MRFLRLFIRFENGSGYEPTDTHLSFSALQFSLFRVLDAVARVSWWTISE
jgi:hypothetical protein